MKTILKVAAIYRKALKEFIAVCARIKNIYPEGTVHDCIDGGDVNPIVLGSTSVGSLDNRK